MGFCWYTFYSDTYNGFAAVAFQFSCIGNGPGATQLLTEVNQMKQNQTKQNQAEQNQTEQNQTEQNQTEQNQDPKPLECVDGFLVGSGLERQLADKWFVVCHYRLFPASVNGSPTNPIFASEK